MDGCGGSRAMDKLGFTSVCLGYSRLFHGTTTLKNNTCANRLQSSRRMVKKKPNPCPILGPLWKATRETQSEQQRCGIRCGDLVQVKTDLVVYHVPKMKGQGISLKDKVGKVIGFCDVYKGEPITANYPIVVEFTHDSLVFTSHLAADELKLVGQESNTATMGEEGDD